MTGDLKLVDGARTVSIQKSESLPDLVVWNIGCVRAFVLKDLGQDEWRKYLCVEAGAVDDRVMSDRKLILTSSLLKNHLVEPCPR